MDSGTAPAGGKSGRDSRHRAPSLVVLLVAFSLAMAACTTTVGSETIDQGQDQVTATRIVDEGTTSTTTPAADPVADLLAAMSAEEKIGQLLMPMVFGTENAVGPGDRTANLRAHGYETPTEIVEAYGLGGVIYLESNVGTAQQLRGLSQDLQVASRQTTGIGLLVAIDQEGGRVSRLSDEVTSFPPASTLAGDAVRVREASYVTGQQVQQQGINVVLAPVADVVAPGEQSFIGNRSFGDDPEQVASMVVAAVDGLQQSGVAAAVKHWPGHGATPVDSHERLPVIDVGRTLWEQRELPPFEAAVEQDVSIVLVGHLALPQLDPSNLPATVSPVLIDEMLRDELGFDGVVMTDALNMRAVADIPPGELAVASVNAGVDVLLIPPSLVEAWQALNQAVVDGRLSEQRLDEAVTRILRLKQNLGLLGTS